MEKKDFEPQILVFACNWCSYAGADLAGISRLQMPVNFRLIRVMCSGRVKPELVVKALTSGVDGVLILGCHPGECHYLNGNYYTRRRGIILKSLLEYMGIESSRFKIGWVSASEGYKFSEIVKEFVKEIKDIGPLNL
ncbi:hypothetical protein DRQ09_01780 [candidate division KSB1 bacterium]|nr:MAG: hypothetical protein DRQ09_01780 [candidate division KSB1 bacterium]